MSDPDATRSELPTLREQRRDELRRRLSDTATALFLERGFGGVTVAEIAAACGVTEKTVFNHFRTKESLLVDRWDDTIAALGTALAAPDVPVVDSTVRLLDRELDFLTERGTATATTMRRVARFGQLLWSTPELVDHNQRGLQRLTTAALAALATRFATSTHDPATRITAYAVAGLVQVFYASVARHVTTHDAQRCRRAVRRDVRRAAQQLRAGVVG
ncbi:transcriptional regulator, TetR family [Jatrophihabitans endophyticus]|uniref:Transcriptional regulator, TetR family n=1 Tax=Jatrophihabitans endophyticus TaxID=1206085 RepID=A0A1M5CLK8_9ACTN|nr:TetR/AcrR family transcriptional regulator [Jatrophihabitans endophyticus]SHF55580.1 transcriptional regulator, TetR family [Jatrophihabitans endophyticus]